jgi:two-component system OmpR family response regulator
MRVLVVEDDLKTAAYIRAGLAESGCEVDVAADGEGGLAKLRGAEFDVLVVDRMLPKLDGLSLVRQLRSEGVSARP